MPVGAGISPPPPLTPTPTHTTQVLLGYYRLPSGLGDPLDIVVNPLGEGARGEEAVWNAGDARCKVITLAQKGKAAEVAAATVAAIAAAAAEGEGEQSAQAAAVVAH